MQSVVMTSSSSPQVIALIETPPAALNTFKTVDVGWIFTESIYPVVTLPYILLTVIFPTINDFVEIAFGVYNIFI